MLPACSSETLTNVLPCAEMPCLHTGHDTPPCHSIQTLGQPIAVLSRGMSHWKPQLQILMFMSDLTEKSFHHLPHTKQTCN